MTLITTKLNVRIDLNSGALSFRDAEGKSILAGEPGGRTLTPTIVEDDKTYHARQEWDLNSGETLLYGLGQHKTGLKNIKGYDIDLWQHNGTVVIPFLTSSRGYGILWDNTS